MSNRRYLLKNLWLLIWDSVRYHLHKPFRSRPKTVPTHYLGFVKPGRAPIVLIQGYGQSWQHAAPLVNHVSLAGHPVHVVADLGKNRADIISSARLVRDHIEKEDIRGAVIVAHSKGCLIGKYLLVHLNSDQRVLGMVALAGPFSGTQAADLIGWPEARELGPGSRVVQALDSERKVNKKIISIYPARDDLIWAQRGSFLPEALDNIRVPINGHTGIFFGKLGREIVLRAVDRLAGS